MNPELTRQIAERLSKLNEGAVAVGHTHTEVTPTSVADAGAVTLNCGQLSSGTISASTMVLSAMGGPKSAFSLGVGDPLVISDESGALATSRLLSYATDLPLELVHHNVPREQMVTLPSVSDVPTFANESVTVGQDDIDIDTEFWNSLGMKGPEDMTPVKLTEITKKLEEFQRGLKRMQRETPVTMGFAVHVKHRTPKKRRKKK